MLNAQKPVELDSERIAPVGAAPASAPTTLTDILALVADDAQRSADEYLDETVVPHGGE